MEKKKPIKTLSKSEKKVKKIDLKKTIKENGIYPIVPDELPILW